MKHTTIKDKLIYDLFMDGIPPREASWIVDSAIRTIDEWDVSVGISKHIDWSAAYDIYPKFHYSMIRSRVYRQRVSIKTAIGWMKKRIDKKGTL